jgi:UDP-glucose 4-epimerase
MCHNLSLKRILVTGGYGFVGTNLVKMLVDEGCSVRILDNLSTGTPAYLSDIRHEFVKGDIRDPSAVDEAMKGIDGVVHLAGHTSVIDSISDPQLDCDINVNGTLTLLQSCVTHCISRFVFASSNAPLGEQEAPVHEQKVPRPLSPYGASKLACEGYCSSFHSTHGLGAVVLRFANVYGPYSNLKTSVVAKFIRTILAGDPLVVYGDGRQTRDFVHVRDICRGIALALDRGAAGETIGIASGKETSVIDMVETLKAISPRPVTVQFEPERAGEIRRNYSDITKARNMLGYEPEVDLPDGLAECFRWFESELGYERNGMTYA